MQTPPSFYLKDDENTLNYILKFPKFYHQVKYLNQNTFPTNKLYQRYDVNYTF